MVGRNLVFRLHQLLCSVHPGTSELSILLEVRLIEDGVVCPLNLKPGFFLTRSHGVSQQYEKRKYKKNACPSA